MKIGLLVPGFSADERDWCIPAHLNFARSLASGNEVHVFSLRYPHRRDSYKVHGALVHSFDGDGRYLFGSAQMRSTVLNAIRREHARSPFVILHSIYGGEPGFVTIIASRWLHVPSVVSFVGGELAALKDIGYGQQLRWRQRMMNQLTLRFADRVLCGSRQMTELARAKTSNNAGERIQYLPLGVDTSMFSPVGVRSNGSGAIRLTGNGSQANRAQGAMHQEQYEGPIAPLSRGTVAHGQEKRITVLNVGSLIPVKNHATLLRAMARFVQDWPEARLEIVGTGPLGPELRASASELRIARQVEFLGAIPHDRLPERYRRADMFVQSSRHEGEGMAVLEAAASGTALVGTAVGVLADLANDGAAIAAPAGDADALAAAMCRALALNAQTSMRARKLAESEYDLRVIQDRHIRLYCSILD